MDIKSGSYLDLLLHYLRPQWRRTILLGFFLLAGTIIQLLNPQIIRYFIDAAAAGSALSALIGAALLFLGAGLLNQALSTLATWLGATVGWIATNELRADVASHCLRLDMDFHNERTPGELIERIDGDVTALANFFSQFLVRLAGAGLLVVGVLVMLFREDWRVGLAVAGYSILATCVLYRIKGIAVAATELEREASATMYGFVEERLTGIDDIRANGAGLDVIGRFHLVLRNMLLRGRRAWMKRSSIWTVIICLFTVGDVIAIGMGIWLFGLGAVTLGTVFLFFQYMQIMGGVVEQIVHQMQDLQKAGAGIARVSELLRIRPTMTDGDGALLPGGALELEFDSVSFGYGEKGAVLDDVSFRLEPGTVLGLLGRTGSGKTTMTRMIFRLYDPAAGTVRLGGVDVRGARLESIRTRVAMVTQEVQLFHASVRDNLTFFDRSIADERIYRVIEELGLGEWYAAMPEGLDTQLTAGGGGLSAGEAQLVAFTRVFLQDPGLVILDEPSSRMDLATERLLERSMQRLLAGRTAIIIAHRLSTVERADEIMVLEHGRIREHGSRVELAADPTSRFARLLRSGHEHHGHREWRRAALPSSLG